MHVPLKYACMYMLKIDHTGKHRNTGLWQAFLLLIANASVMSGKRLKTCLSHAEMIKNRHYKLNTQFKVLICVALMYF